MKIKSKKKLLRAIILVLGIAALIVFILTTKSSSHQELKYKSISVISGDTLWNIAKKEQQTNLYYDGKDLRDVIEDIKEVNNLKSSSLSINQILEIPTY